MLNIYRNFTPNYGNNLHYYFKDFNKYLNLLSPYLLSYVDPNNYKFNNNIFMIALGEHIKVSNYKEITYIVNTDTNVCYLVEDAIIQSGYIILNCSVDYWGTYIYKADFYNINIKRTNKNIGVGVYDEIKFDKSNEIFRFPLLSNEQVEGHKDRLKYSEASIVFVTTYNVDTTISGAISTTDIFAVNLETLYNLVDYKKANPVDIAISIIGGVFKVGFKNSQTGQNLYHTGKVLKAYIVPNKLIEINNEALPITIKSKCKFKDAEELVILVNNVKHIVKDYDEELIINNPDYNYYIGTPYDGLKIIRTNEVKPKFTYRVAVDVDALKITILQGGNQKDITNNFEVALTYNDGDVTKLSGILNGINTLAGVFAGGLKMASSSALDGALGIGGSLYGGLLPYTDKTRLGQQVGTGDGFININSNDDNSAGLGLVNPLGYCRALSNDEEGTLASLYGINFDDYVSNFDEVFDAEFINNRCLHPYIKAFVNLNNVPVSALNIIQSKFQTGIYIERII